MQSDPQSPLSWVPLAQLIATSVVGVGTLLVLVFNYIINRRSLELAAQLKRADIQCECHRRYDQLMQTREQLDSDSGQKKVLAYYERFWMAILEEHRHWVNGYIDDDLYAYWLDEIRQGYLDNEVLGTISYREGWNHAKTRMPKNHFPGFVEQAFTEGSALVRTKALLGSQTVQKQLPHAQRQ